MTSNESSVDERTALADPEIGDAADAPSSRRRLLKLAAGAAAGGTAVALAKATGTVSAVDGGNVVIGAPAFNVQGDTGRTTTVIDYQNAQGPQASTGIIGGFGPANVFLVRDNPGGVIVLGKATSSYPAAVAGYGTGPVPNGVYGVSSRNGYGVVGYGTQPDSRGILARGRRANLELHPDGSAPATRVDDHRTGELITDNTGTLWYCVAGGTPGTWRKLASEETAGAFHAVAPFRVYDSRLEPAGRFAGGENRTIAVRDSRDVNTYAVTQADAVPPGATAVAANVVAIGTTDVGFVSINPGGDTAIRAATVNWSPGQNIGNAGIFAVNPAREVEAIFGPGAGAHLTIDITGYFR